MLYPIYIFKIYLICQRTEEFIRTPTSALFCICSWYCCETFSNGSRSVNAEIHLSDKLSLQKIPRREMPWRNARKWDIKVVRDNKMKCYQKIELHKYGMVEDRLFISRVQARPGANYNGSTLYLFSSFVYR